MMDNRYDFYTSYIKMTNYKLFEYAKYNLDFLLVANKSLMHFNETLSYKD